MNRRAVALCITFGIVFLSGCSGFGNVTSQSAFMEDREYNWELTTDARILIDGDSYEAVVNTSGRDRLEFYQTTPYGDDRPLGIRAVKFRHSNGTIVDARSMQIVETRSEVIVELPANNGTFAYTAPTQPKQFSTVTYVKGSYEVILPEHHRVDNFLLSTVRPSGYETEIRDDRVHIHWNDVRSNSILIRYFLDRDRYIFVGLLVITAIGGTIAIGYVWRQIRSLRKIREDIDSDFEGFSD